MPNLSVPGIKLINEESKAELPPKHMAYTPATSGRGTASSLSAKCTEVDADVSLFSAPFSRSSRIACVLPSVHRDNLRFGLYMPPSVKIPMVMHRLVRGVILSDAIGIASRRAQAQATKLHTRCLNTAHVRSENECVYDRTQPIGQR